MTTAFARRGTGIGVSLAIMLTLAACGSESGNEADAAGANELSALPQPSPSDNEAIANTVVESVRHLPDTTKFMAALTASGVGETLTSEGPFTVFLPSDSAFDLLPVGTFDTLSTPENKATLAAIVNYHVVRGSLKLSDLRALLKEGGGTAMLKTLSGLDLTAKADGDMITLTDTTGKVATIGTADIAAGNGDVHFIDKVLMPNPG